MPASKSVWGIDIGQCALKAIKLRVMGERIEAVAFDVIEHAKILSQPDADRYQLVRNALDKFVSRNEIGGDKVVISVPGQTSFARFIKLPPVEPKRIPEIVDYEAAQQIPFNIDDVEWAWQRIVTPDAAEVEVGIFAIKKDIIDDLLTNFKDAGINVNVVQMAPLALYNFLQTDQRVGTGTTILVDIGAENTDLVVADGHRIWLRNIPLGGNNFTESLVKGFKLTFAKAENLKRTAANSKYARQIFQAMRPVFSDLVAEVQRSIGFYTSLHRDARVERIVGLGNAFRLPGLQKFLQQNLQVEVEKVESFNVLGPSAATQGPAFRDNLLSFAVSYGLALQGLGLTPLANNLLPLREVRRISWEKKKLWFVGSAAAAALCWACAFYRVSADGATLDVAKSDPAIYDSVMNRYDLERRNYQAARTDMQKWLDQMDEYRVRRPQYVRLWANALDRITRELPSYDVATIYAGNIVRASRRQIFINNVSVEFFEDSEQGYRNKYTEYTAGAGGTGGAAEMGGAMGPGGPGGGLGAQPAQGAKVPGFVITIEGTTPFGGSVPGSRQFLQDFMDRLAPRKETAEGTPAPAPEPAAAPADGSQVTFENGAIVERKPAVSTGTGTFGPSAGTAGVYDPLKPDELINGDTWFRAILLLRTPTREASQP